MTAPRYYARSASDRTDDWPFWFVADSQRGGLNVTNELVREHFPKLHRPGAVFLPREFAEGLAAAVNEKEFSP
jgi:hypothetical protein